MSFVVLADSNGQEYFILEEHAVPPPEAEH
jgi:hypothetical protein